MGLLTRMTTLFKADAHGVVDSIEERSLLLKQHLLESEPAHPFERTPSRPHDGSVAVATIDRR